MIQNTSPQEISRIVRLQREFFAKGDTLDVNYRLRALKALKKAILSHESDITKALWTDLHKSYEEAYLTEISIVLGEIKNHISHLKRWASPKRVCTPLKMFPSRSRVESSPLGCALIIAPWNYPVQLLLNPLVGAISAGCTAILKPSPYVPHVSKVLEDIISATFSEQYIATVQGNRDVNAALLEERHDIIFFTGSPQLGRKVMSAAAKHLTPVVLELGGKSPCIVDSDADIAMAAKRIAWGKSLNAGQTCIAPDYLLVHQDVKQELVKALQQEFTRLLGKDPSKSEHFVRIVNEKSYDRLVNYLADAHILMGGDCRREERYISPTIIDDVNPDSPVMQEEIFGPIFPLVTFSSTQEAIDFVTHREKPLALYYFGKKMAKHVLKHTQSGGACINDTIMHIANEKLPFGGVGASGMSAYHGKESFDVFSHHRAVVSTTTLLDLPFRYMPYTFFRWVKGLL